MILNGIFLAAFQEIGVVDTVFAGKLHASDTQSVFLGDGDLGFQDTEEVTFLRLEHNLIHLVGCSYEYKAVILCKLGGNNGTLGSTELFSFYQLAHAILCNKEYCGGCYLTQRCHIEDLLGSTVIITQIICRNTFITETHQVSVKIQILSVFMQVKT